MLPLFFIVEMVTVQFDMLLLLHSMLGERKLTERWAQAFSRKDLDFRLVQLP